MFGDTLRKTLLSSIGGGEFHPREKLSGDSAELFESYIKVGSLLKSCAMNPALVEPLIDRLINHRSAIVGSVPPGLMPHSLIAEVRNDESPASLRRALSELDEGSLRQWIIDDASLVYGELKDEELSGYFSELSKLISDRKHFVDLGSGLGKVVMTAAVSIYFESYSGVELIPYRHNLALQRFGAFSSILREGLTDYSADDLSFSFVEDESVTKEHLSTIPERIEFILKDLFDADVSRASMIFIYSTCFGSLMHRISEKLANEAPEGCLASSTTYQLDHPGLELVRYYPSNTLAWTSVYIYRRVGNGPWPKIEPKPLYRENDEEKWKEEARKALSRLQ